MIVMHQYSCNASCVHALHVLISYEERKYMYFPSGDSQCITYKQIFFSSGLLACNLDEGVL